MGIKKIFLTGLFFAMALVGWAQNGQPNYDGVNDVYEIDNVDDLVYINEHWADLLYSGSAGLEFESGKEYDLTNKNWISNIEIHGNVYGNGATIKFKSETNNGGATGLFKSISCEEGIEVANLKIEATIIDKGEDVHGSCVGALANEVDGYDLTISKIYVSGRSGEDGILCSNYFVGGLIGKINDNSNVTIRDCVSDIDAKGVQVGGIVGNISVMESLNVSIFKCISKGEFNGLNDDNSSAVGGILGNLSASLGEGNLLIEACANKGNIGSDCKFSGGIVGKVSLHETFYMSINSCYNTGVIQYGGMNTYASFVGMVNGGIEDNLNISHSFAFYPEGTYEAAPGIIGDGEMVTTDVYTNGGDYDNLFATGGLAYTLNYDNYCEDEDNVTGKYFVQLLDSKNMPSVANKSYPVLYFEEVNHENFGVYRSCADPNSYTNNVRDGLWSNDPTGTPEHYSHLPEDYDEVYHVCMVCGELDRENADWSETIIIEEENSLKNMGDALDALSNAEIPVLVDVAADVTYSDIDYTQLSTQELDEQLITSSSIGTKDKPFIGLFNGNSYSFINYAVKQNGIFGHIGKSGDENKEANKNIKIKDLSVVNGVMYNDLTNPIVDGSDVYVAALANVNNGVISYCSYVGTISVPEGATNVVSCLVGENSGEISYSFMYITNLDELKTITSGVLGENKAAIIVKGNTGVAKKAGGKQKKVAVNNKANKLLALNPDAYFTPEEAELNKEERGFSNEEFASGVVAYWLNYAEAGYTGEYTCRYSQGEYTPELQSEAQAASDGGAAVHKIVYDVPEGTSISSGAKPFANGGEEVVITLSQPVKSASVTTGDGNKSATAATLSADGKTITFTVPKTKKPVVMLSASNNATALTRVEPNSEAKIVVIDGKVKVFGAQGETVVVYGINGAVLHSEVLTSDKVDLPAVPHGIYFVKVGGATKKISL